VHPRVLRFDDEDTQVSASDRARSSSVEPDPDATREVQALSESAAAQAPRLAAELHVARDGAVLASSAEITGVSRDAVFVATSERPDPGCPVLVRVHSRFGVGTASGRIESHLSGAGFIVRLSASNHGFAEFADELRAYAEGRGRGAPPLAGPVELHVLEIL